VILWVYWPLTQELVKQVRTLAQSHFRPLISTLTFNSDTHQLGHLTLTLTLRMTILTVLSSVTSWAIDIFVLIAYSLPIGVPL
jgi:hypothetical protein